MQAIRLLLLLLLLCVLLAFKGNRKAYAAEETDTVVVCVLDSGYGSAGTADPEESDVSEERDASESGEASESVDTSEYGEGIEDIDGGNTIRGWNYLEDSDDITDEQGHGTDICTLIAENAPDAEIVMLKCFDEAIAPDGDAVVKALYAAVDDYQADIINMSWTVSEEDEELLEAVQYAAGQGVVLIASAGNLSLTTGLGSKVYPALWEEVIGVGGVNLDEEGNPAAASLWYLSGEAVYICAHGEYGDGKGSSYAAARISGVVADYLAGNPDTDADTVRQMLRDAALDLGESGYDTTYGWGYVAAETRF